MLLVQLYSQYVLGLNKTVVELYLGFHVKCKSFAFILQLILFLEETGLEEEGILRVPGSVSRIKVSQ